jgi:hypothetical protein
MLPITKLEEYLYTFDLADFDGAVLRIGALQKMWKGRQSPGKVLDFMIMSYQIKITGKPPQRKIYGLLLALLQARVSRGVALPAIVA